MVIHQHKEIDMATLDKDAWDRIEYAVGNFPLEVEIADIDGDETEEQTTALDTFARVAEDVLSVYQELATAFDLPTKW